MTQAAIYKSKHHFQSREEKEMGRKGGLLLGAVWMLVCAAQVSMIEGATTVPLNGLRLHYYKHNTTCKRAEEYITYMVKEAWIANHSITPALLRLLYSDCMVTGCDASILLDGKGSEKTAPQNSGLRGFDLIDKIKKNLEKLCPGVVSCADILNLATRDAVGLAGAPKYPVFTGRRDGMRSTARSVDLPSPYITWDEALAYFQSRGLDVLDLGTLLGAHTVGVTHCRYVYDRLYNFKGTGLPDPSMDRKLAAYLRRTCPRYQKPKKDPTVFLNPSSNARSYTFTNSYYHRVMANQTVLWIDQQFLTSGDGYRIALEFDRGFEDFRKSFALSMSRMGSLGVLTGNRGEIRKKCSRINARNPSLN